MDSSSKYTGLSCGDREITEGILDNCFCLKISHPVPPLLFSVYIQLLGGLTRKYGLNCFQYADGFFYFTISTNAESEVECFFSGYGNNSGMDESKLVEVQSREDRSHDRSLAEATRGNGRGYMGPSDSECISIVCSQIRVLLDIQVLLHNQNCVFCCVKCIF